jgi:hypothetical protein
LHDELEFRQKHPLRAARIVASVASADGVEGDMALILTVAVWLVWKATKEIKSGDFW